MAFSLHLLVHIVQAILFRGYIPGIVSSLLLLPYSFLGLQSIWYSMTAMELLLWGTAGVAFMVTNLLFAHRLGTFLTHNP